MQRLVWATVLGLVAGCHGGSGDGSTDMAQGIPDGHLLIGCQSNDDCSQGDPCMVDTCQADHSCSHVAMDCSGVASDTCKRGACMVVNGMGTCQAIPANEGGACMTAGPTPAPGKCLMGICSQTPQCQESMNAVWGTTPACGVQLQDDTTMGYQNVLSDYACAKGEDAPEMYFPFVTTLDRTVTVSITPGFDVDGGAPSLDVIVLDGSSCIADAKCVASSPMAGTPGKVTFNAKANNPYTIVVDGKGGAKGPFTINFGCSALCQQKGALPCNMTTASTTVGASSNVSSTCGGNDPGPENAWSLAPTSDTIYNLKLTGLTTPLDLVAVQASSPTTPDCDSSTCMGSPSFPTTNADRTLSFTGASGQVYDVVVDSQMMSGGAYSLQLACAPSCAQGASSFSPRDPTISCSSPSASLSNDDASSSTMLIDSWGPPASPCATGLTGPEVVYQFMPNASGLHTFTLSGLTADLELVVIAGDSSNCDPTSACVAQNVTTGTADKAVSFMADSTKVYYIAVDGRAGAVSPYTLKLTSQACPGPDCYNFNNGYFGCSYLEETRRNDDKVHSTNLVDSWKCDPNTTGPEVVYYFTPPALGQYTVTLDQLTANLDLIVEMSPNMTATCDPSQTCVQSSTKTGTTPESVTFTGDPANGYYFIAVDGVAGAIGNYHIKLSSTQCGAATCTDGSFSDDLSCGGTMAVFNTNDASGATSDVSTWGKSTQPTLYDSGLTGPEFAHQFIPPKAGTYSFEMIGLHANLDLIAIQSDMTGACSPNDIVVAVSKNTGTTEEALSFAASATATYYLVADGQAGAISSYTLAITGGCP
jgi:hypothetical protein